jgi:transcriptional regulator with XRE-family HTH domain
MNEFGKLISLHLIDKKNGMTQHEFANVMETSAGNISNIVSGKKDPDFRFLVKCRNFFKLNKEETLRFFSAAISSSRNIPINMSCLTETRRELLTKAIIALLFIPPGEPEETIHDHFSKAYDRFLELTSEMELYDIDI